MTLYFENRRGEWRPIAECAEKIDVYAAIKQFVEEQNQTRPPEKQFQINYWRVWDSDGYTHYDIGSWTEFFHWGPPIEKEE